MLMSQLNATPTLLTTPVSFLDTRASLNVTTAARNATTDPFFITSISFLATRAPFEVTRAAFLDARPVSLDGTPLKKVRVAVVQGAGMSGEDVPPTSDTSAPTSGDDAAEAAATPAPADATPGPNAVISNEKEENDGTFSPDARNTGQEEPESNMSPCPSPATHAERVVSVEVQVAIRNRLRNRGVWKQDIEDLAQDVTTELLSMAEPPPDMDGCVAAARKAANDESMDALRKGTRRSLRNAGPTAEADRFTAADHASPPCCDPVDRTKQVEMLRDHVAKQELSERDARMLILDADGASAAEIGRTLKLQPQTVRNRLSIVRRIVRQAWEAKTRIGAALALLLALFAAWWTIARPKPQVVLPETPVPSVRPATSTERPEPNATLDQAAELREKAFAACMRDDWSTCEKGLDEAKKVDPDGERDGRVQAARNDIEIATSRMPGSRWKPAEPRMYDPARKP
jgi:DNA-directed RNA polymerase specialized sigma24 family protein